MKFQKIERVYESYYDVLHYDMVPFTLFVYYIMHFHFVSSTSFEKHFGSFWQG